MLKAEIIQTVISLDPSRKVEDLEGMKVVDLTELVEQLNNPQSEESTDEQDEPATEESIEVAPSEVADDNGLEEVAEENKSASAPSYVIAEKASIAVKGRIFTAKSDDFDPSMLPEGSLENMVKKGVLKKV